MTLICYPHFCLFLLELVILFICIILESLVYEAGYFYTISQNSKLTVNFVQLTEKEQLEDQAESISKAMKQIRNFEPEVILLYTDEANTELILKKVTTEQDKCLN